MKSLAGPVVALLIALTACGGGDDATPTPIKGSLVVANPNVCDLLTIQEVEEITGMKEVTVQNRDRGDFPSFECYWGSAASAIESLDVAIVSARSTELTGVGAEVVDGLGDAALMHYDPVILEVVDLPWAIAVSPFTMKATTREQARDISIELARLILERLPDH